MRNGFTLTILVFVAGLGIGTVIAIADGNIILGVIFGIATGLALTILFAHWRHLNKNTHNTDP